MTFFGFALADSMFSGDATICRRDLTVEEAKNLVVSGVISACNPSHQATIAAMRSRFGIDVAIPTAPPRVSLKSGDSPTDEVAGATFVFSEYVVQ